MGKAKRTRAANVRSKAAVGAANTPERRHLASLAGALTSHQVWARVIEEDTPVLRVSNPDSIYATEDVLCERNGSGHAFRASFGVDLGTTEDIPATADRIARLLGTS
ncbi:hypothetical protein [Spiractinospora alimapuensis]|uniref:hypothetical protein n=1 Tax=Spiractinospora alimapuensis TaxID=2820884 RepID=UPI001F37F38C|nr:hypothetical protein [Spiractinospora alimapuensis]